MRPAALHHSRELVQQTSIGGGWEVDLAAGVVSG